jgi:hypothetical protein
MRDYRVTVGKDGRLWRTTTVAAKSLLAAQRQAEVRYHWFTHLGAVITASEQPDKRVQDWLVLGN